MNGMNGVKRRVLLGQYSRVQESAKTSHIPMDVGREKVLTTPVYNRQAVLVPV